MPPLWQKGLRPVLPLVDEVIKPVLVGQFTMFTQAVREAPSGPHVSGREMQL